MALEYYDDALVAKLMNWTPSDKKLRVLKPSETKELFKLNADDKRDKNFTLPAIALSRNTDIELLMNIKNSRSFKGINLGRTSNESIILNQIPIKLEYQLDIFAKKAEEAEEYLREYLFKLINNPKIYIEVPYNDVNFEHVANIRVQSNVSDTSDISERVFPGQFTRWTINLEIQDAFLFSIKYKKNWKLYVEDEDGMLHPIDNSTGKLLPISESGDLEVAEDLVEEEEFSETLPPTLIK